MNINTSIGLRDRSRITLSNFKGLDTLSAAVDVSAIHATDMKNLISRDGVNHKRFGWKTQFRIRDNTGQYLKIQGIFSFTIFHEKFLLAYAGKKFWLLYDNGDYKDITNKAVKKETHTICKRSDIAPIDDNSLKDAECKFFINGNKVYFVGCGDFLVFSRWGRDEEEYFELRRVVGNEDDVYIPTTTENIGCEEDGKKYTRITAEEKNILSPYIKNTLFGKKELLDGKVATYFLDKENFSEIEVIVKTSNNREVKLEKTDKKGTYSIGEIIKSTTANFNNLTLSKNSSAKVEKQVDSEMVAGISETIGSVNVFLKSRGGSYGGYIFHEFGIEVDTLEVEQVVTRNNVFGKVLSKRDSWNGSVIFGFNSSDDLRKFTEGMSVSDSASTTIEYGSGKFLITSTSSSKIDIDVHSQINLISMENGDRLILQNSVLEKSDLTETTVDSVNISYTVPKTCSSKLIFIHNDKENILHQFTSINITTIIKSIKVSNEDINIELELCYDMPDVSFDLTKFNVKIKEIHQGSYTNFDSFLLIGTLDDVEYCGSVSFESAILSLYPVSGNPGAYSPLTDDIPNIEVKLKINNDSSLITTSKLGTVFGILGSADRLFLVDNTGNTVRWSKDEDFTYFGEKSWCVCGTSDKSITGMDRLNDSTLLIVKEYSPREPSIFIITGNILTGETEAGTVDYTALFTPHGYQVGMGAVGEIVNFNGECIMVAKDGLYAVSLGENMTVDSRYVLHRSRQISNKLEKFDLSKAKCVSFNGKFFVYVGGEEQECYVADNKYTASFEGDIQNVVNYEWWRWTNIPVNVWGFVENELWFGTEDGQLCSFTENFYDETITNIPAGKGLVYYDCGDTTDSCECGKIIGIGFNPNIKFQIGDVFTPTCDFYGGITTNRFICDDNEIKFYLPLEDYKDGETIFIDNLPYTITKKELYFSIMLNTDETKPTELTFYRNYKKKPLTVIDDVVLVLKDSADNFPVWSNTTSSGGLNPSIGDFSATLSHKEPVVSKWVSGAMDLGTRAYSKSLTYLVLTGEKDLANRLKYGLKTRFTHRDYELLRANNDLDFTELDLQTVSMDSDFASSYTKKLNIRNINFLMLYFVSDTAEDIALNSVQIEFKLYKRNIGVR